MQLDQITANIRLRNPWEAIDLGFALVRHFWREIYLPWFIFLSLLSALIFVLLPADYQPYGTLAVWWLKPLYDRFLLNILSQRLFNEPVTTAQALRALPVLAKTTGLLSALTFRRPSFSRGFNLPVWQLEQLRGKARAERQRTLLQSAHSHAIGLTIGMIFMELAIYFSLIAILFAFLPQGTADPGLLALLFDDEPPEDVALWLNLLDHVLYTSAILLIEPFYIAASFTLYINRRTQLEAWDIELVFRQIGKRLKQSTQAGKSLLSISLLSASLLAAGTLSPTPAIANDTQTPQEEYLAPERLPATQAAAVIKAIMQRPELSNEKKSHTWVKIEKDEEDEEQDRSDWYRNLITFFKPFVKLVSILFESSLWVALGIGIIALILTRKHWLHLFRPGNRNTNTHAAPEVLFGMDIRPESLPEDIPAAARKLWQQQQHREALSLLYRGALARMANADQLPLKSSQTEGDILKLAQQNLPAPRHTYLQQLTRLWIQIAYAHQQPADEQVDTLLNHWHSQWDTATTTPGDQHE